MIEKKTAAILLVAVFVIGAAAVVYVNSTDNEQANDLKDNLSNGALDVKERFLSKMPSFGEEKNESIDVFIFEKAYEMVREQISNLWKCA